MTQTLPASTSRSAPRVEARHRPREPRTQLDDKLHVRVSQLMTRYGAGDTRAFAELYSLLRPRLGRLCGAVVKSSEVDDLLQEVFMKLHRHRASFVPHGNAVAWSYAVARRTCIDRLREPARTREIATEQERLELRGSERVADSDDDVSATLQTRLAFLSDCVRETYVLVKLQGMSCAEAASALGTTTGAIKQRVHRANAELRAELRAAGVERTAVKRMRDKQCAEA